LFVLILVPSEQLELVVVALLDDACPRRLHIEFLSFFPTRVVLVHVELVPDQSDFVPGGLLGVKHVEFVPAFDVLFGDAESDQLEFLELDAGVVAVHVELLFERVLQLELDVVDLVELHGEVGFGIGLEGLINVLDSGHYVALFPVIIRDQVRILADVAILQPPGLFLVFR